MIPEKTTVLNLTVTADETPKVTVHSLPCKVEHTGKALVSDYFIARDKGTVHPTSSGVYGTLLADTKTGSDKSKYAVPDKKSAYFRGRQMILSDTIDLHAASFKGVVLAEHSDNDTVNDRQDDEKIEDARTKKEKKVWKVQATFDQINVWQLTTTPARTDYTHSFTDWFQVASALAK